MESPQGPEFLCPPSGALPPSPTRVHERAPRGISLSPDPGWHDFEPIPEVRLQQPSPLRRDPSLHPGFHSRNSSLEVTTPTEPIVLVRGALQVPGPASSLGGSRRASMSSSAFAASRINSTVDTVASDIERERERDFDDIDPSFFGRQASLIKRKAGFADIVNVQYSSFCRTPSSCEDASQLQGGEEHVLDNAGDQEEDSLLEDAEYSLQRFSELRTRQLELLARLRSEAKRMRPSPRQLESTAQKDRRNKQHSTSIRGRPVPFLAHLRGLVQRHVGPKGPAKNDAEADQVVAHWEIFRMAVIKAYGSSSLEWPEEIKYTYAVCFNRAVEKLGQSSVTHTSLPTTIPFDLSAFDKGSLRTEVYASPLVKK